MMDKDTIMRVLIGEVEKTLERNVLIKIIEKDLKARGTLATWDYALTTCIEKGQIDVGTGRAIRGIIDEIEAEIGMVDNIMYSSFVNRTVEKYPDHTEMIAIAMVSAILARKVQGRMARCNEYVSYSRPKRSSGS
ncbi:MAG: hypothetical protein FWC53_01475 [Firmicutes bacterium]|nr:hypothetical protein [Bacillota bacterium]